MRPLIVFLFAFLFALPAMALNTAPDAAANQAFLTVNAHKPGVISRPSGWPYRILRSGFGGRPGPADSVRINYSGSLINGTVFDGTSASLPAVLPLSSISLRGLSEALQLMHAGDRWQIVVPANLAFGGRGTGNGAVGPNQTLVFDLTLVSVTYADRSAPQTGPMSLSAMNREMGNTREQGAILTIPQ
jgi:FKBP-type peptidyl-prolyl cis-trans isomerase FklB